MIFRTMPILEGIKWILPPQAVSEKKQEASFSQ